MRLFGQVTDEQAVAAKQMADQDFAESATEVERRRAAALKRAAERRLKATRFPTYKTLDNFDFAAQPSVNKTLVGELMRCVWIEQRENVLLVGNPGTGTTHVATALAVEVCGRGAPGGR